MDIENPVIDKVILNDSVTLAMGDNEVADIPPIRIGYVARLAVYNPGLVACVITLMDEFLPDSSDGNPSPTLVSSLPRYTLLVPAGDFIDLNGHRISKHLGLLNINASVAGCIASYILELE
jgi:hypothetical protein